MENNGNQNLASSLCKAGCGFFGNQQFDGMCSKCYKDSVKRKQATPTDSTPLVSSSSSAQSNVATTSNSIPDTTPSVETALPTVPALVKSETGSTQESSASSTASGGEEVDCNESPSKIKKRNRCLTCKKKVGLTGFECRCGGLYCSIHRYSDKHGCEFDYKELGADHIRKNNPVVVGEKVQKL